MEKTFMNTENSKMSKPHRFKLNLIEKLNLLYLPRILVKILGKYNKQQQI